MIKSYNYESSHNTTQISGAWPTLSTAIQQLLPSHKLTQSKKHITKNIHQAWKNKDKDWFHTSISFAIMMSIAALGPFAGLCTLTSNPAIAGAIYAAVAAGITLIIAASVAIHHHKKQQFSQNQHRLLADRMVVRDHQAVVAGEKISEPTGQAV